VAAGTPTPRGKSCSIRNVYLFIKLVALMTLELYLFLSSLAAEDNLPGTRTFPRLSSVLFFQNPIYTSILATQIFKEI